MKSFSIGREDIARIACALTADELSRRFNHYTDFVTQSIWQGDTPLGEDGLDLNQDQLKACAARLCAFFAIAEETIVPARDDCFYEWADAVGAAIKRELKQFRFWPASITSAAQSSHPAEEIWQDARMVASLLTGRRRVVSLVSPHSLFGFISTVLAPNLQLIPVLDGRRMPVDMLGEELAFGDALVATPTLWRYIGETLGSLPNNIVGVSFGEPLLPQLATDLREKGLGAMRELYGSTETGLIAWRDAPTEPFVLFDHWRRNGNDLIRVNPAARERPVGAMDHLNWTSDRAFTLGGRRDGAVQISGINVFPDKIGTIIAEHRQIATCTIRVVSHNGSLDRLIADITLEKGVDPDESMAWAVDSWCRKKLRPPERPRIYNFD